MSKPVPIWWHSRTKWAGTQEVVGGRFWKPGCRGFNGLLFEETHPAEPLYDQKTVDQLVAECDRLQKANANERIHLSILSEEFVKLRDQLAAATEELEVCSEPIPHGTGSIPCGKCQWCKIAKALDNTMKPAE